MEANPCYGTSDMLHVKMEFNSNPIKKQTAGECADDIRANSTKPKKTSRRYCVGFAVAVFTSIIFLVAAFAIASSCYLYLQVKGLESKMEQLEQRNLSQSCTPETRTCTISTRGNSYWKHCSTPSLTINYQVGSIHIS